jgi:hypothetical protein
MNNRLVLFTFIDANATTLHHVEVPFGVNLSDHFQRMHPEAKLLCEKGLQVVMYHLPTYQAWRELFLRNVSPTDWPVGDKAVGTPVSRLDASNYALAVAWDELPQAEKDKFEPEFGFKVWRAPRDLEDVANRIVFYDEDRLTNVWQTLVDLDIPLNLDKGPTMLLEVVATRVSAKDELRMSIIWVLFANHRWWDWGATPEKMHPVMRSVFCH